MNWIQHPVVLDGTRVRLEPLQHDHFPALISIAKAPQIWEKMSIDGTDERVMTQQLSSAILKRGTGEQYPFAVIDKHTGEVIGSTMFHNIYPEHRKLEIGWTWYAPSYWRTGYNRECKLLLLTYCFDKLNTVRVQFQAGESNLRSRTAILGIGASYEGTLRKERIRSNGDFRNTMMFSIIDDEWQAVKAALIARLHIT